MFEQLKQMVNKANKIALFTHTHPDGDALGSSFAFMLGLVQMGKKARVFFDDSIDTKEYRQICGKDKMADISVEECDLMIALDCADAGRIELCGATFRGATAAIDHHITHAPYADETIVVDAPATGEIVFDILTSWGVEITSDMANDMYIAIACDTGHFKFSSTTPKTHRVIATLMELGADYAKIARELFYKLSREYLALYQTALLRLEVIGDGRGCMMYLSDEDFKEAGLDEELAGDIVSLPTKIEGVEIGAYIRCREDGFKISLRSNEFVDVSKIALKFGGGGHVHAAGFSSELPLDDLKKIISEELENALKVV